MGNLDPFLQSIFSSTIANIISTFIFASVSITIFLFVYFRNRLKKLNFFGVSHLSPDLKIFVSRLEIRRRGAEGHIPIDRGFIGPAIVKLEYDAALLIQQELESKTIALLPRKFRDWLGAQSVVLRQISLPIEISPKGNQAGNIREYMGSNLIVVGSSMYNLVSKYYLETYMPQHVTRYCFYEKNRKGERIIGVRHRAAYVSDILIQGRSMNRELAFIQKIKDIKTQNTTFLCIGHGSAASFGAVRYLVGKWQDLSLKYGDKSFIICLAFQDQRVNDELVVSPEVAWETEVI